MSLQHGLFAISSETHIVVGVGLSNKKNSSLNFLIIFWGKDYFSVSMSLSSTIGFSQQ